MTEILADRDAVVVLSCTTVGWIMGGDIVLFEH